MHSAPPVPQLLDALASFAQQIAVLLATPGINWHKRPDEESWSLSEVMCHLRDVEYEVHWPRYLAVISKENPFLAGAVSDEWATTRAYRAQDGREAAVSFLALRRQSLETLRALDYEDWQRTGTHAFFGTTSLQELMNLAVQHDTSHWQQIEELLTGAA